jgi:hypothetical protein
MLLSLSLSLLLTFKGCVITAETAMRVSFVNNSALGSASFSDSVCEKERKIK